MEQMTQKKRGPKKRFGPREEFHLKFSLEVTKFIQSQGKGVQAYLDQIIAKDMKEKTNA